MKCPRCPIGDDRKPLYRSTPKGEDTVWMCWDHLPEEYKPMANEVKELSELIAWK